MTITIIIIISLTCFIRSETILGNLWLLRLMVLYLSLVHFALHIDIYLFSTIDKWKCIEHIYYESRNNHYYYEYEIVTY